jgi:cyclase
MVGVGRLTMWLAMVAAALWSPTVARAEPRGERAAFRAETLATGVYAIRPTTTGALGADANSLLVVGSREALVVDAQFSASSTRSVLTLVGTLTNKPVRWLVNTHWHDDHVSGNAEWVRANPGITIVGATAMRDDMLRDGAKNRASFLSSAAGTARYLNDRVTKAKGLDDSNADSTELEAFRSYVTLIERAAAESASTRPTPPTRVFDGAMSIDLGGQRVRVVEIGAAHTRADVVVQVPSAGVIASGDIVMWPVPFVGSTSYPAQFGPTLDRLLAMPHRMIVPGHGPVQRDDTHVRAIRDMVVTISTQVDSLRRAGVPRDSVRARISASGSMTPFRDRFAGADRTRRMLWDVYVMSSAIPKAYDDGALADSAKR